MFETFAFLSTIAFVSVFVLLVKMERSARAKEEDKPEPPTPPES